MHSRRTFEFDTHGFKFAVKFFVLMLVVITAVQYSAPAVSGYIASRSVEDIPVVENKQVAAAVVALPKKITIGFVGDIMLDRQIRKIVESNGRDYTFPFELAKKELSKFDFVFGNLEGPISNKGVDQQSLYSFRMDPSAANVLKDIGVGMLSVANNHIRDWGDEAMDDTFLVLQNAGVAYVGAGSGGKEAYTPKIVLIRDTKIGFVAFTDIYRMYVKSTDITKPKMALLTKEYLVEGIEEARKNSDIVIVSIHFGDEYTTEPNERQKEFGRLAIDSGADLVIGHHPHTVQPVEEYNGGYIAYSLGNFIFDQNFSEETSTGLLLGVTILNKEIKSVEKKIFKFNDSFQPYF